MIYHLFPRFKTPFRTLAAVSSIALATSSSTLADVTMRPVPLDCGGWVAGYSVNAKGRVYAFGDVFGMWRSDDAGQSWKYLLHDFTEYDHFVCGSAIPTNDLETVVFLGNRKLFRSANGGASWSVVSDRYKPEMTYGATPIIFQPASTKEMWLASAHKRETGWLWHTVDAGATWTKVAGNTFDNVKAVTIYVRPEFPDQIWVGTGRGLWVSADHGVTFTNVWDNNGGGRSPMGYPPTVTAIARQSNGTGYFASNIGGYRVTATDYNDPKTYKVDVVVPRVQGSGPSVATVLADGSFVTADNNGTYGKISTDAGVTWVALDMKLDPKNTPIYMVPDPAAKAPGGRNMIVQDPTKPTRWFMTGGKAPSITEDSGKTWNYPPNGSGIAGVVVYGKIGFPKGDPMKALIPAADQGVFVVNDGGMTGKADNCSRRSYNKHAIFQSTMYSNDGKTIVAAGCEQGGNTNLIYRSADGGKTWEDLDVKSCGLPLSDEGIQRAVAAPGSSTDFLVLLGFRGDRKNNNPGMYRTTDGGKTFVKSTGIPDGIDTGHRYDPSPSHLETDGIKTNIRYLALRSANNEAARGVYRSIDGGSTWAKTASEPFGKAWITEMTVDPTVAGRLWVTGKGKGLHRSDDGGDTWTQVGDFIDSGHVTAVKGYMAVWGKRRGDQWNKLFYSADDGAKWVEITGPGRRLPFLLNVTINPHKLNEVWVSGISVNILTVDAKTMRDAKPAKDLATAPSVK